MNYWPADTTNLSECYEPVFGMINDLTVSGARTAQVQYSAGGWVTHHNTDGWRGIVGRRLRRCAGMWQTGGAWLATMIWDHYLFTGDLDFLRQYYPAMKGAAQFFLDTLVQEPSLGLPGHEPVELPGTGPPLRASASAPAPRWTTRSCATCSTAAPRPARRSASTPTSGRGSWPPGTGSRR